MQKVNAESISQSAVLLSKQEADDRKCQANKPYNQHLLIPQWNTQLFEQLFGVCRPHNLLVYTKYCEQNGNDERNDMHSQQNCIDKFCDLGQSPP